MTPRELVQKRPTEIVTGLALAAAVGKELVDAGVPDLAAGAAALVIAFVPTGISGLVDRLKGGEAKAAATIAVKVTAMDPAEIEELVEAKVAEALADLAREAAAP